MPTEPFVLRYEFEDSLFTYNFLIMMILIGKRYKEYAGKLVNQFRVGKIPLSIEFKQALKILKHVNLH